MTKRYDCLIFDADYTLLDYVADEMNAFRRLYTRLGMPVSAALMEDSRKFSEEKWTQAGLYDVYLPHVQAHYHTLYRAHVEHIFEAVFEKYGYTLTESTTEEIEKITLGTSHGGIIAVAEEREIPDISQLFEPKPNGFYCMIQGIEDPYNFGYSLRSLYACGCDGIILPKRNWMSAAGVVARSSAGASELFPIYTAEALRAAEFFKAHGYSIICADENTDNVLGKCVLKAPLLLIVGGEKRGISRALLELADIRVKIDYAREFRASLSAASATTMFAYEIMRQNTDK